MAKIEDLIDEIADPALRERIAGEVRELKRTKRFGLVFEEHIPETVSLYGLPIREGLMVQNRTTPDDLTEFRVLRVADGHAAVVPKGADGPETWIAVEDLLVVKRFHEQIFPGLTPVGDVRRGDAGKPAHVVINGENFHALQVLRWAYAGKVDCIYIDPPYNTGDKSWKYNNRFVDENDAYRHSKWLSFMEKRLRMAKPLLKPDGVLVVTIDEHEVHHLGVLLEQLFPEARRQMVTIVINTAGAQRPSGFTRAEEHAFFCFFGNARPSPLRDDLLADESRAKTLQLWFPLVRSRGIDDRPSKRPGLVYPVAVDPETGQIVGTGRTLKERVDAGEVEGDLDNWIPPSSNVDFENCDIEWPLLDGRVMSRWQLKPKTLMDLARHGFVRLRRRDNSVQDSGRSWSISYVKMGNRKRVLNREIPTLGTESSGALILGTAERRVVPKTVWKRGSHDARIRGTRTLRQLIGDNTFSYPKSPYAVFDTLSTVVIDNPEAVILDFFAGSGTTLQATAMLNANDGGSRRCILVTNNDLSEDDASSFHKDGVFVGDPAFERRGIFESVTRPRVDAAVTGQRRDGEPVEGEYLHQYLEGRRLSDGLSENVQHLRLDYLEPDLVDLGRQFNVVVPMLWMAAGSIGEWEEWDGIAPWSLPKGSTYGVLFYDQHSAPFAQAVDAHASVTHVWLVTNSRTSFLEMRSALPEERRLRVRQLYRDYLRNFTVNAPGALGE
ncbi:site-specific DNA-methyltransferase [Candidatus Spongiisocius sp.]|uniref:site-specific DNA-methyltransferase n=1 Tax=Candidatus Spongiisocius sp. TaxID=3101273 RepID=UPI003B593DFC